MIEPAKIVAEIGCNHKGDLQIAKEMLEVAKVFCKVQYVKFQKRTPRETLSESEYNSPHPNPIHSYGETYGKHREQLEFSIEQHRELMNYCERLGLVYSCSVWDLTSAAEIVSLNPRFIKIPSACNTHFEMLDHICSEFSGEIHLSLGMTTREEERGIVQFFTERKRNQDLVLYACTSGYPVPDRDVCLFEVPRLLQSYTGKVKAVGFSGHHLGVALDVAAFTLGAQWIERHFTLDRTWRGTDHAASLEPDGLRRVARDVRSVADALTYKTSDILPIEEPQRTKLKWNRPASGKYTKGNP